MNIAVIFEGRLQDGGGFQQQLSTILELNKVKNHNFIIFVFSNETLLFLQSFGLDVKLIKESFFNKVFRLIIRKSFFNYFISKFKIISFFEKQLSFNNIDIVYFLSPSTFALDLVKHNYIITVWDLCHRDMLEFPEVNYYREFEIREMLYNKILKKSVAVLVDSDLSKENILFRYGIDKHRIYTVSFMPSVNMELQAKVDIKSKYSIVGDYIYYPAQFWSHKNHVYIIDALALLKDEGIFVSAVFSGSDKGNLEYVLEYAAKKGMSNQVNYIGFADDNDIFSLYKNALAMVMPSYFGPTNIPPLEAFRVGTPVIYSDLDGLRDQVKDAALLCDLTQPSHLAMLLKKLLLSDDLRQSLVFKGKQRLEDFSCTTINSVICNIIQQYEIKLKCWKI